MAEIDVLKAQVVRENSQSPWGFRLKGGVDYGEPLTICRVTPGSAAARIGLQCGDVITEIEDTVTQSLTNEQAHQLVKQYGLSIILTIERRAAGGVPVNPVIQQHSSTPPLKPYQPYDLTGATRANQHGDFQTAVARPYGGPPAGTRVRSNPPPHHQAQQQQPSPGGAVSPPQQQYHQPLPAVNGGYNYPQQTSPVSLVAPPAAYAAPQHVRRVPDEEKYMDGAAQSRTFRILQSVMHSEEPAAGSYGLPRQRSAYMEEQRAAREAKQNAGRVKVFMPQQYNSPIGMYSARNMIDTFQNQAEIQMQELERQAQ